MARLKLTAKGVEALRADRPQEDFWDALTPGLCLRVSGVTGRKTWLVRYRANGTHRRTKLGEYPVLSLAGARDAARRSLAKADAGGDPGREREELRSGALTFKAMAEEVLEARKLRTRERTQRERARILKRELIPEWGERAPWTIERREVVALVERIARRGAPTTANRTLTLVGLLFNDAIRRGFPNVTANPAHLVEHPGVERGRDRYLLSDEIQKVWQATDAERPQVRGAVRLALLTAQRIGSICRMNWDTVEGPEWTIPAEYFKGKRPHMVPLSEESFKVLAALLEETGTERSGWVFPSRSGTRRPYVTNLSGSLSRIRDRSGLPHWTLHDFRTTFRTWAVRSPEDGGLGVAAHVADAVLGHKEASLGFARYTGDRDRYLLAEKREALRRWGGFVASALEGDG